MTMRQVHLHIVGAYISCYTIPKLNTDWTGLRACSLCSVDVDHVIFLLSVYIWNTKFVLDFSCSVMCIVVIKAVTIF